MQYALIAAVLGVGIVLAVTHPRYRAAVEAGRAATSGGRIASTAFGDLEYGERGAGPAVLIVHGAGGGFDQGLLFGETFVGEGVRIIAPSRFGYLKSAIPPDGSPAAQADAYAALLDLLGVHRVALLAVSDGGPSALQFALRYPERTAALVMISAKSRSAPPDTLLQRVVFGTIFRSSYVYWGLTIVGRSALLGMLGVPPEVLAHTDERGQRLISAVTDGMTPISQRRRGIYHDRATLAVLPPEQFALERITAPTLVVHARDDGLQPFSHAEYTVSRVPGAQLLAYDRGGHMLSLQVDEVRARVAELLAKHGPG
ncbi:MAG: alpha/beta hydrolase [Chloroflexota bacterium]